VTLIILITSMQVRPPPLTQMRSPQPALPFVNKLIYDSLVESVVCAKTAPVTRNKYLRRVCLAAVVRRGGRRSCAGRLLSHSVVRF